MKRPLSRCKRTCPKRSGLLPRLPNGNGGVIPHRPLPPVRCSRKRPENCAFPPKKTMRLAQQLYEGLPLGKEGTLGGLITYMRTDATRVSNEAVAEVRGLIKEQMGPPEYITPKPRQYAAKKGAQEAHEAIRPTSSVRRPEDIKSFLKRDQYRLYELIWNRFVASQMSSAIFDATRVDIKVADYTFRATGSQLKFAGFLRLYQEGSDADGGAQEELEDRLLPALQVGEILDLANLNLQQHFTQAPPPLYGGDAGANFGRRGDRTAQHLRAHH